MKEKGKAPGVNRGAWLYGAQRGEMAGRSRSQAGQRSSLLSGLGPFLSCVLAGDVSQPSEKQRKHPCLVWSSAEPVMESVGVWTCTWVIFFYLSAFHAILCSSGAILKCLKIERCLSLFPSLLPPCISHHQGNGLMDLFVFLDLLCWRDGKNESGESPSMVTVLSSKLSLL